jgi:hypothetical protein
MPFNIPEPDRGAYILNRLFTFPTDSGPQLAVSVRATNADRLISFYTLLVKAALVQLWTITVILGVSFSLRQRDRSHNSVAVATGVLNAKRPLEVGELSFDYLWKLKRRAPKGLLVWLTTAVLALAMSAGIPTLVGPYIIVGHGAPVNPARIYVPDAGGDTRELSLKVGSLEVPSALRAAGSVQSANLTGYNDKIQIDDVEKIGERTDLGEGEIVNRYRYRYNVTAKDFGLQHFNGLALHVEGSCTTEYDWLAKSVIQDGVPIDTYYLWNNASNAIDLSIYNSPMPFAYFRPAEVAREERTKRNTSFAIVISAIERKSYTQGKDPFYLTDSKPSKKNPPYQVFFGRPVLSCWQSDSWVYKNEQFSVTTLNRPDGPLADLPESLNLIFTRFLSQPKIMTLGTHLGASALLSTATSRGEIFDAGTASVHSDLSRLVVAAYVATTNTLGDTTLFANGSQSAITGIPNLLHNDQIEDAAQFVIYSGNLRALSVSALASIPLVWATMFVLAWMVTSRSWFPWFHVQGLQATILYSLLDRERHKEALSSPTDGGELADASAGQASNNHKWKDDGQLAWFEGVKPIPACYVPPRKGNKSQAMDSGITVQVEQNDSRYVGATSPTKEQGNVLETIVAG